jgi:hypothetical protein
LSIALLAFCFWALMAGQSHNRPVAAVVNGAQLAAWSLSGPDSVHVTLGAAPGAVERDWLAALAGAGTAVTWSGTPVPLAVERIPSADPAGGVAILAAGPSGATVRLADSLGVIDSARLAGAGARFEVSDAGGALTIAAGGEHAGAGARDSIAPRHVAVLGNAEWESRFVVAALEERGWAVDVRLAVAPGIVVRQGSALPLDTTRQSAVVVLDSLSPGDAALVARFVSSGGGVVIVPRAALSLRAIAAGSLQPRVLPELLSFASATPMRALALTPITPRSDAIVLESQGRRAVIVARRVGAGRVIQIAYDDTWRWRMAGVGDAVDEHRAWWARTVAAAAYVPLERAQGPQAGEDRAPLAELVAALGPARAAAPPAAAGGDLRALLPLAGALLFLSLLGEWASRRLRGAP